MTSVGVGGHTRRGSGRFTAMVLALVASAVFAGTAAAAPAPPPGGSNLFATSRSVAISAARVRLSLYVRDHPADVAAVEPVACPLVAPEAIAAAAAATSGSRAVDLRLYLDPWTAQTSANPELRPASATPGVEVGLPIVTCGGGRPDDPALTRPSLFAISLRSGVAFRDVARVYGVEPALPVAASGIGGQMSGSCLAASVTGVCVTVWSSGSLVLGMTLDGPRGAVNPATPADLLTGSIPEIVNNLAVQIAPARGCDSGSILADTGVALIGEPVCHGGWAMSSGAECPADGPCPTRLLFQVDPSGWRSMGSVDVTCAETLAPFGMTGNTARQFTNPCDANAPVLQYRSARPGSVGHNTRAIQIALVSLGYVMPVDGRYGPLTQAAVLDYQTRNGLSVDGIAGRQTQGSLGI